MTGRATFVPGVGLVSVVPGTHPRQLIVLDPPQALRYVTENAAKGVTGQYDGQIPRADTPIQSHRVKNGWVDRGIWAVVAVGAGALIADGAILWFLAGLIR